MDWVVPPGVAPVPVVACLPHDGTEFPAELCAGLAVDPSLLWSDWLTRDLYDFLPELGITTVTTRFSRFVADVNRDPAGQRFGPLRTSVVAERLSDGRPVYHTPPGTAELQRRIDLVHRPYHHALDAVIAAHLRTAPRVLVLDLHSFGAPVDADVVLGDRRGATAAPEITGALRQAFTGNGFAVRVNERYAGGWTVRRFAGYPRVDAVQIELNKRCYLDYPARLTRDLPPPPRNNFYEVKARLRAAVAAMCAGEQDIAV